MPGVRLIPLVFAVMFAACLSHPIIRPQIPQSPVEGVRVVRAGHATVWVDIKGFRFLTDPLFTHKLGGVFLRKEALGLDPEALPPIDVALISHSHMDHFDPWSLSKLAPGVPVFFPPDSKRFQAWLSPRPTFGFDWWQSRLVINREGRAARITAVPAQHWGGYLGFDGLWSGTFGGWIVEAEGFTVYFAGDTGYNPDMFVEIGKRFPHIDLALLPIGPVRGREPSPRWERHHINPPQALAAFRMLGARVMVPIHYGAFWQSPADPNEPMSWLADEIMGSPLSRRVAVLPAGDLLRLRRQAGTVLVWERESDGMVQTLGTMQAAAEPSTAIR